LECIAQTKNDHKNRRLVRLHKGIQSVPSGLKSYHHPLTYYVTKNRARTAKVDFFRLAGSSWSGWQPIFGHNAPPLRFWGQRL